MPRLTLSLSALTDILDEFEEDVKRAQIEQMLATVASVPFFPAKAAAIALNQDSAAQEEVLARATKSSAAEALVKPLIFSA